VTRASLDKKLSKIKLLAMDVDGVLTDGKIIILNSGEEVKEWNVKDRIGFFMMKREGYRLAWITGRKSRQVESRAKEIGVDVLVQHADHKGKALLEAMRKLGVSPAETLFIGDDLVDLPAFKAAGVAVAPADAHAEARGRADWVTKAAGGWGVFREAADRVMKAQKVYDRVLARFENPDRRPNP
jgi:3-deoxy-D-manno-octulosonate 8-phosphate phosphatase (KDO 8-P phosphatase)